MAKELRVNSDYNINVGSNDVNITADAFQVTGNLVVTGTTTTVNTTDLDIQDNTIVLNKNESGAGVTLGTAGVVIERGTSDDTSLIWNETTDKWSFKLGSGLADLEALSVTTTGDLTVNGVTISDILDEDNMASDSATALATQQSIKAYVDTAAGSPTPGGANTNIQYNNSGTLAGSSNIVFDNGTNAVTITGELSVDNININANDIISSNTNGNITLTPNGTGNIVLSKAASVSVQLDFTDQGGDPGATVSVNKIYSKTPSGGGTGLYFVNNTTSGEMISKSKAIAYALVFGG